MFGMLSPASRGALMTAAIVLFMFMGLVAGYNGARMYRTLKGTHWKRAAGLTASLYPGVVFGVGFFLNFFIWGKHSSGAVSQQTGMLCGRLVGVRGGRILWVVWARRVYLRTLCRYFPYHCSGILFTEKLLLSVVHLSHPLPFPSPFLLSLSSLFFHFSFTLPSNTILSQLPPPGTLHHHAGPPDHVVWHIIPTRVHRLLLWLP